MATTKKNQPSSVIGRKTKTAAASPLRQISTPRADLFLQVHSKKIHAKKAPADQSAGNVLKLLGDKLTKPGLKRETVFVGGARRGVYAYSVNPENPAQMVRQDASGKSTVGRVVNGVFRPVNQ